jgi:ABC-type glycerol-3-phosphate transport system substrate-binding protein
MIALGQYSNVDNAKDILATLLLQNGNPIVARGNDPTSISFVSMLNSNPSNLSISPIEAVIKFFIEFSNPANTAYSWNRSLPSSLDMFTGGKLAFYIGKASELFNIQSINPNLSFDVTGIPQIKDSTAKRTYGEIYAIAINKKSSNPAGAFGVAGMLSLGDNAKNFSVAVSLPPASRALLSTKPADPYLFTFFNSALISRSWLDPDKVKSDSIFKEMIENILSNNLSVGEAISKAQDQLDLLLKK